MRTTLQQKKEIEQLTEAGNPSPEIALATGLSLRVVRKRRERLNRHIPSRSTGKQPPLVACPQAEKSARAYRPDLEKEIFDSQRVKKFLAAGRWFRTVSKDKTICIGGRVYCLPKARPKSELETKFNPYNATFLFFDADRKFVNSRPAQGLSFNELAGGLEKFKRFCENHNVLLT